MIDLAKIAQEAGRQALDNALTERQKELKRIGLSRRYYLKKLKSLCEATKPISCIQGKDADGGTVDFVDVPDNRVQLDSVKEVIKLWGDYPAEKREIMGDVDIVIRDCVKEASDGSGD